MRYQTLAKITVQGVTLLMVLPFSMVETQTWYFRFHPKGRLELIGVVDVLL